MAGSIAIVVALQAGFRGNTRCTGARSEDAHNQKKKSEAVSHCKWSILVEKRFDCTALALQRSVLGASPVAQDEVTEKAKTKEKAEKKDEVKVP